MLPFTVAGRSVPAASTLSANTGICRPDAHGPPASIASLMTQLAHRPRTGWNSRRTGRSQWP